MRKLRQKNWRRWRWEGLQCSHTILCVLALPQFLPFLLGVPLPSAPCLRLWLSPADHSLPVFPLGADPLTPNFGCICCFPASPKGGWLHGGEIWGVCSFKLIQAPAAAHSRLSGKTHRGTDGTWPAFSPFLAASAQCWPLLEAPLTPAGAQPRGPAPAPGPGLIFPQTELLSLHLEQLPRATQSWWPHSHPHLALRSRLTVTSVPPPL